MITRISGIARPLLLAGILVVLLPTGLVACGGGQGEALAPSGRATITVVWPGRSRLVPAASNSIRIGIKQGAQAIGSQLVARPANGTSSTVTFDPLPTGDLVADASAYPVADGTGTAQATGTAPLHVSASQNTAFTITMDSTIDHLEIGPANPTTNVGQTVQLTVTAKDSNGSVVLLSPAKQSWDTLSPGVATVDGAGLVSGLSSGPATIKATDSESGKFTTIVVAVSSANQTPWLYDGFDYTVGQNLGGLNGGTGPWGDPWNDYGQGNTPSVIAAGSLSFKNLLTTGQSFMSTSDRPVGNARQFANPPGQDGTTLYMSCLIQPVDAMNVGWPTTYFGMGIGGVAFDKPGNSDYYCIEGPGSTVVPTSVKPVPGVTVFLVGRITFRPGPDLVEMWVNPTPGQPLPAPDATRSDVDLNITDFGFGASIRCIWDEIRMGTTWEQVSPIK